MTQLNLLKNNKTVRIFLIKIIDSNSVHFFDADYEYLQTVDISNVDENGRSPHLSAAIAEYGQIQPPAVIVNYDDIFLSQLLNRIDQD